MTKNTFLVCRIAAVLVVAIVSGVSVANNNWYLPIAFLVAAWVFLFVLKNRVREVITDERDYVVSGRASAHTITAYNVIAVIAGLILYVTQKDNAILFYVGNTLLYSACFIMVVYAVLFKIYERKNDRG